MTPDPTHSSPPPDPTRSAVSDLSTRPPTGTSTGSRGTDLDTAPRAPLADVLTRDGDFDPIPSPFDTPSGFAVEGVLGEGGMGVVYLARQVGLNRPVALKLVRGDTRVDAKQLVRFLAEAETVAAIRHPNVVEVYAYGDHRGRPYLALEYCPGGDLTTLTKVERVRDVNWFRRVAELMAGVADGVNAAHAQGIVHRDLKPHNVFLAVDGTPKVADFGLAKRGVGSDLTQTDAVMGTPAYMSPEQAGGGTKFVGPEADVWSLGVMLYELCCGERPIPLDPAIPLRDNLARVARAELPALRTKCPRVPTDLAHIARKCLSADPRDRYPTSGALANDVRNWLEGKPISARPAGVAEQAVKWAKRNKRLAVMGAAVLLTMGLATGVSVGFGLYAGEQATEARNEKQKVIGKSDELTSALSNLRESNEQTQRTLAKALLGPIKSEQEPFLNLSEYETNTLWQLAALREGPVPLMVLEEATDSRLTTVQFRCRGEFLFHAAVGLDSRLRAAADELILARLRNPKCSPGWKSDVALAAVYAERFSDASAEVLVTALKDNFGFERGALADGLVKVAGRLPPDQAAEVLVAALKGATAWNERMNLADGLVKVAGRLPPDQAEKVCGQAAEMLVSAFKEAKSRSGERSLATTWAGMAARLPTEKAADLCGLLAEVLVAALKSTNDWNERRNWAEGLVKVAGRLPVDKAAEICGQVAEILVAAMKATTDGWGLPDLAAILEKAAVKLPAGRAEKLCREAADVLLAAIRVAPHGYELLRLAEGLAAVAGRLPADKAAEICGQAAEILVAAMKGATLRSLRGVWAEGLAAVAGRLPADKAAEICGQAAEILIAAMSRKPEPFQQREWAEGLAAVAGRLPADKAAEVCGLAYEVTLAILEKETSPRLQGELAMGLLMLIELMPAGREVAFGTAADAIVASTDSEFVRSEFSMRADWLAVAASGVRGRNSRRYKLAPTVAALLGGVSHHPAILRPLRPQHLVELLKHPFVVKEARRAVLDALEVTYDRPFSDLWAFVAFTEKEHPELDLLTPPRRPEKR